ncbi:MAG: rhodanese-like domain-containing protein [Bacteroidales bacterium]|nr:rhodanese-like domain-containing protein [Bacteroidales bacterium]
MKKFIKKNALFLSALVVVIIIILIIAISNRPSVTYKMTKDNLAGLLKDSSQLISPVELDALLEQKKGTLVMVDIRSFEEYSKGHIKESVNIPVMNLLDKNALSFFDELSSKGQEAILYGDDQLQANGPWLLLKQVGVKNVKILQGGYQLYKLLPLNDSLTSLTKHLVWVERSIIDTSALRKKTTLVSLPVAGKPKAEKEKVIPVKKEESGGGGC